MAIDTLIAGAAFAVKAVGERLDDGRFFVATSMATHAKQVILDW
jgi:hypothetical protein